MSDNHLLVGNDNDIALKAVRRPATNGYVTDAEPVATVTGPGVAGYEVALAYVTGSQGNYVGVLPADVPLEDGEVYTIDIADAVNGISRTYTVTAREHGEDLAAE